MFLRISLVSLTPTLASPSVRSRTDCTCALSCSLVFEISSIPNRIKIEITNRTWYKCTVNDTIPLHSVERQTFKAAVY